MKNAFCLKHIVSHTFIPHRYEKIVCFMFEIMFETIFKIFDWIKRRTWNHVIINFENVRLFQIIIPLGDWFNCDRRYRLYWNKLIRHQLKLFLMEMHSLQRSFMVTQTRLASKLWKLSETGRKSVFSRCTSFIVKTIWNNP